MRSHWWGQTSEQTCPREATCARHLVRTITTRAPSAGLSARSRSRRVGRRVCLCARDREQVERPRGNHLRSGGACWPQFRSRSRASALIAVSSAARDRCELALPVALATFSIAPPHKHLLFYSTLSLLTIHILLCSAQLSSHRLFASRCRLARELILSKAIDLSGNDVIASTSSGSAIKPSRAVVFSWRAQ